MKGVILEGEEIEWGYFCQVRRLKGVILEGEEIEGVILEGEEIEGSHFGR